MSAVSNEEGHSKLRPLSVMPEIFTGEALDICPKTPPTKRPACIETVPETERFATLPPSNLPTAPPTRYLPLSVTPTTFTLLIFVLYAYQSIHLFGIFP